MHKGLIRTGSILAAVTVILGAFAAHGLKQTLSAYGLSVFETGVKYQFYHSIGILFAAIIYKDFPSRKIITACILFITGIALFSGSLFILALNEDSKWLGAITPFGGLSFIAGWIMLALATFQKRD
jgi:uncharacterized membrane protein YgdD (TMEM256/DUF423 family)